MNLQHSQNQTVFCILGMHRSGTSCLTGSLEQHGLYLGKVINSAPHNLKGNKENRDSWEINDEVMQLSGGAWDNPPDRLSWNDQSRAKRDAFISCYSDQAVWGFKDPRCMLTLPFWLEALPDMRFVGTFRHPLSVARSLEKRNGFAYDVSFNLWQAYNLKLIDYHKQFRFPIISFDWPDEQYRQSIITIALKLGLTPNPTSESDGHFFEPELRHQEISNTQTDMHDIPDSCLQLYQQLCELSSTL